MINLREKPSNDVRVNKLSNALFFHKNLHVHGQKIFNISSIEFFTNLTNPEQNTLDFVSPTKETGKLLSRKDNISRSFLDFHIRSSFA